MLPKGNNSVIPFFGEISIFAKCPISFIQKRIKAFGNIFCSEILGKTTFFVTTWNNVKDAMLKRYNLSEGYSEFMKIHFGANVLTDDCNEHSVPNVNNVDIKDMHINIVNIKDIIVKVLEFSRESPFMKSLREIQVLHIQRWIQKESTKNIYEDAKALALDILNSLFLPRNISTRDFQMIQELLTTHFRGITSTVPIKINFLNLFKSKSQQGKESMEKLKIMFQQCIEKRMQEFNNMQEFDNMSNYNSLNIFDKIALEVFYNHLTMEEAITHLILFNFKITSKALGSLFTSAIVQLSSEDVSSLNVEHFTQEILRMYPPIIGCCRKLPLGHTIEINDTSNFTTKHDTLTNNNNNNTSRVWGCIWTANRDESVFAESNSFNPNRWNGIHKMNFIDNDIHKMNNIDNGIQKMNFIENDIQNYPHSLTLFQCPAQNLITIILETFVESYIQNVSSSSFVPNYDKIGKKYFPVMRPLDPIQITFTSQSSQRRI